MGQRNRVVGAVLGLVLVASLVLMPSAVLADDVYYYPTEDSYIRDDSESNFGSSTYLCICDQYEDESNDNIIRSLIRIDDQTGGGNVTSVLLRLYYVDEFEGDAEGKKVRVYRCTEDFQEMEVDWYEWKDGWEWTSEGGDYTTVNYAEAEMPSEGGYITWNITEMCEDAWVTDEEDLYVIIRYKYENKDLGSPSSSWSFFRSAEYGGGGGSYNPRVTVTYEEEVQTPEVDADMDEYTSSYVEINVYPTLYDWPSANVSCQVAQSGGGLELGRGQSDGD